VSNKAWSKNRYAALAAAVLGLTIGWTLGAQDKPAKQWKSQEEYQLANDAGKEGDPAKRLATLDKWKQGYAQSDYADVRDYLYIVTYQQMQNCRKAFDASVDVLKARPNDFPALQAIEGCIYTINGSNPPVGADLDAAERVSKYILSNADAVFAGDNHPLTLTPEQFQQAKEPMKAYAQRTVGYIYMQRKDAANAEVEILKGLKMDPTQTQFAYWLAQQLLSQQQKNPEKAPLALFYFARAAAYDGPGSMPAAQRKTTQDYLTRAYTSYHGSNQDLDKLLALAKTTPFPPEGFSIVSVADIKQKQAEEEEKARQANPMMTTWTDVKKALTGADGQSYFDMNVKESGFPKMKGILISMSPATRPKELVLAIEKADVPDAKLVFEMPLAGKMDPGAELEFEGVPSSFTKDPYTLVFDVEKEKLTGWKPVAAPAKPAAGKAGTKAAPKAPPKQ